MFKKFCITTFIIFSLCNVAHSKPSISFIGDSISYGMGKSGNYSNGGIIGSGVSIGNRERNENHWKKFSYGTKLTIVEIGTNDFGYTGKNYKELLSKYILPVNNRENICMVQTPVAVRPDVKKGVLNLIPIEREWSKENNIRYVPFPDYTMNDRLKDGLHFTPKAYKRFADTVASACLKH